MKEAGQVAFPINVGKPEVGKMGLEHLNAIVWQDSFFLFLLELFDNRVYSVAEKPASQHSLFKVI